MDFKYVESMLKVYVKTIDQNLEQLSSDWENICLLWKIVLVWWNGYLRISTDSN